NATEFFGVLYDLLNPERYSTACEWLRGDDLDDESLALLKVKQSIDSEDAAQKILANVGRIAIETQPIVLCFDQLDNIALTSDGLIDLQALYTVNSSIHNQGLKNFCVIISIITNTLRGNMSRVQPADHARIDHQLALRPIPLSQAKSLWMSRLAPLHRQAVPQPESSIFPFSTAVLAEKFPGGKTFPRNVLELGRRLLQSYKTGQAPQSLRLDGDRLQAGTDDSAVPTQTNSSTNEQSFDEAIATFRLLWRKERGQTQQRISRIRQLAAPELVQMLLEVLAVFSMKDARTRLLPSQTYASHSLSYQRPRTPGRIGIVWNEDANMTTFYHVMNACRRVVELGLCDTLFLIRGEGIGQPGRKGYMMHEQIFDGQPHQRIRPDLASVHDLATYHSLVNAAYAGELVIAGQVAALSDLEQLTLKSKVLHSCRLLQELSIVSGRSPRSRTKQLSKSQLKHELQPVREFLLDLVKTHQLLGYQIVVQAMMDQFPERSPEHIDLVIQDLMKSNDIEVLDPTAKPDEQLIYFVA
ncbi:MAG: ATP-binding protein, partial [Cyanobacteria bacterium J06626_14]